MAGLCWLAGDGLTLGLAADGGRYVSGVGRPGRLGPTSKKKLKFQKQFILNSKKVEEKIWNSKKKSYEVPKFKIVREKIENSKNNSYQIPKKWRKTFGIPK